MKKLNAQKNIKASIFITCLIDTFYPEVGESMVKVLSKFGVEMEFLSEQTCCGQPAFNSGFQDDARSVAKRFLRVFEKEVRSESSYIVCPSGSCATMTKVFYEELFKNEPRTLESWERISPKIHEFTDFLVNILKTEDVGACYEGTVTYHDSCHLLRELKIKDEPRRLIRSVDRARFVEMDMSDACCGFGGTFSVKLPKVSVAMLDEKIECILESGADAVVSTDMGCLMQIRGALNRRNIPVKAMHIAELLAS